MTCIGYVTGFRFQSQGRQRRLLDFLSSDLCQLMCWGTGGPLFLYFRQGRRDGQGGGIKDTFIHSTGGTGPKSPPQDLITLSSFSHWHVVARHSQPNLCLHEQAWQKGSGSKRPLRGLLTHTAAKWLILFYFFENGRSLNVCLTRKNNKSLPSWKCCFFADVLFRLVVCGCSFLMLHSGNLWLQHRNSPWPS